MPTNQLITNQTKFLHEVINNFYFPGFEKLYENLRDLANDSAKAQYDHTSALVEQMLEFQRKFQEEGDNREKEKLSEAITQLDQRIDQKVHGLYDLNEEEIAMVEREIGGK